MCTLPPIPYPAIKRHGVIGDRRTAALVSADGTIDWLCLPDYDSDIIFGALLDAKKGGFWNFGPIARRLGRQSYASDSATVVTTWDLDNAALELMDLMPWPDDRRPPGTENQRALVRRLRCLKGSAECRLAFAPARNFQPARLQEAASSTASFRVGKHELGLWFSRPFQADSSGIIEEFTLQEGEEAWCVLAWGHRASDWDAELARQLMDESSRYWQNWTRGLSCPGPRADRLRRSAILVHQLGYAPTGSHVAAVTTSLPERIGGDWNSDYRLCWVRDTSLSLAGLAMLGNTEGARRYVEWQGRLESSTQSPLQVVYGIRGETRLIQKEWDELQGYRGSRPVRVGNHAFLQNQHGSMGYLIDCLHIYLEHNGPWQMEFWNLVCRVADYIASHWQEPSNSIWELPVQQQYLSGKILGWAALDRAIKIAGELGLSEGVPRWRTVRDQIHAEVMEQGWSNRLGAFRQRYEGDNLDAAVLLIPIMDFLPPDHTRVLATLDRIADDLTIDGFVYRFDPLGTPGLRPLPLGEYEGAFLPCTFWLAIACAKAGRLQQAEAILRRAEDLAGEIGLFSEGVDPRTDDFLGNTPLLFSQVEYVRAVLALAKARGG